MIPTPHFRWWIDSASKLPVLQQLWVNVRPDDSGAMERVFDWMPHRLRDEYCGEWRNVPVIQAA